MTSPTPLQPVRRKRRWTPTPTVAMDASPGRSRSDLREPGPGCTGLRRVYSLDMTHDRLLGKQLHCGLIVVLLVFLATVSVAQDEDNEVGLYGTLRGGLSFPSSTVDAYSNEAGSLEFDTGYDAGFSAGFQLTDWVRWDLVDFSYFRSNRVPNSVTMNLPEDLYIGYGGNGLSLSTGFRFGDFRASSRFRPYVSMGLGATRAQIDFNGEDTSEWGMNADIGFGIEYALWKHLAIGLRYQFRWVNMNVDFDPVPPPGGLRVVDLSVQYQTLSLELVFF